MATFLSIPQFVRTFAGRFLPRRWTAPPKLARGNASELERLYVPEPTNPYRMLTPERYEPTPEATVTEPKTKSREPRCTFKFKFGSVHLFLLAIFLWAMWIVTRAIYTYASTHPTERVFPSAKALNGYLYLPFALWVSYCAAMVTLMIWLDVLTLRLQAWTEELCLTLPVTGIVLGVVIGIPTIVPLIFKDVGLTNAWNRRCDADAMQVILAARSFDSPLATLTEAHFYRHGFQYPILTYSLGAIRPHTWDEVTFNLTRFDVSRDEIPSDLVPQVQSIRYDIANHTLVGGCVVSGNASLTDCVTGTYIPGISFSFHDKATSQVEQLNVTTRGWRFRDEAPALTVRTSAGDIVMKTVFPDPYDCTRLKVCVPHDKIDASLLVPLGMVLQEQANFALKCTAPAPK
ncbi:hypothetical protein EXIGLDRAFT_840412, partial [Exidia glandulosa HHB12029]